MEQNQEDNAIVKKHEKVVYIFNMSEDVWPFISAISGRVERQQEIDENANLADRELFSIAEEDDAIFISPKPISDAFLLYYKALIGIKKLELLVPNVHTGCICEDIVADTGLIDYLITAANSVKKLTLKSYSASPQFFELVNVLREKGITVYTPESPEEESAWSVNFYGSKSGIRQLAGASSAREPDFKMPDGVICSGIVDASKIAAHKYIKENGVVIKTNKGHSGFGVLIYRSGDLPTTYNECEKEITKILKKEAYWDKFPIIIESFININPSIAGGFPNVEFKIQKSGKIDFLYPCGLRVTKDGGFKGIEIHEDIVTERVSARIIDTGFFIAEQYAATGYRGYFDVDYVAAKNGEIYVTESNARRTGGTHVYKTAVELIGKDFLKDSYVLSDNVYQLPKGIRPTFERVADRLSSLLFDKKTKEGVVICSSNLLGQGKLSYIIFGTTKKRALEIEEQMEIFLKTLTS